MAHSVGSGFDLRLRFARPIYYKPRKGKPDYEPTFLLTATVHADITQLRRYITTLASERFSGRQTGTEGERHLFVAHARTQCRLAHPESFPSAAVMPPQSHHLHCNRQSQIES